MRYIKGGFFEKNIQENKDWNPFYLYSCALVAHFEKNIQENKDWNDGIPKATIARKMLREKHPREQGLKPDDDSHALTLSPAFEKNIQENKDWNNLCRGEGTLFLPLREKHPREQGLKLDEFKSDPQDAATSRKTSKRTRIETTS